MNFREHPQTLLNMNPIYICISRFAKDQNPSRSRSAGKSSGREMLPWIGEIQHQLETMGNRCHSRASWVLRNEFHPSTSVCQAAVQKLQTNARCTLPKISMGLTRSIMVLGSLSGSMFVCGRVSDSWRFASRSNDCLPILVNLGGTWGHSLSLPAKTRGSSIFVSRC